MAGAAEKNSTLVLPIPVELPRFVEKGVQGAPSGRESAVGLQRTPKGRFQDRSRPHALLMVRSLAVFAERRERV
jgi:hypothetical protein